VAACRTSSSEHPPSMRARGLGVGEYCEEERPSLQLRSSTGSSSPACVHLAAAVHPTAYSPRRRPLRASRDESRKSEHVTARGLNAATRDMAAIAEAARCAASKWSTNLSLHHAPRLRRRTYAYACTSNRTAWQDGASITVRVNRNGTGNLTAGWLLCWSIGSARATSRRHEINFSELDRPQHRY